MTERILITDTLYMSPAHHESLRARGYEIVHFEGASATEDELCDLVPDIDGYVLGGVETITARVVEAASHLRGIAFCGSGWTEWIQAHDQLTARGIPITTTAGSNAAAVAQYTTLLTLAAARNLPRLWSVNPGGPIASATPHEFESLLVGVVGLGHIGKATSSYLQSLGLRVVELDRAAMASETRFETLASLNIVALCVSKTHGAGVLGAEELSNLQDGAAIVNAAFPEAVNAAALYDELTSKRLRAFFDGPYEEGTAANDLIVHAPSQSAFVTPETIERTSDWATESIINLLTTGNDGRVVNFDFANHRQ